MSNYKLIDSCPYTAVEPLGSSWTIPLGQHRIDLKWRELRSGLSQGVQMLTVDTGAIVVEVLPTRGMSIWKAWLGETHVGWHSPVKGPVHPAFVPIADATGIGWLEGFDELFVRCGLTSNGAPDSRRTGV